MSFLRGLMQDWPLTTDRFIEHAAYSHGHREVVSRLPDGTIGRKTYAEVQHDAKRISSALIGAGITQGDCVATLAMNGVEHLEAWYAISGIGAVCHTLNPRYTDEQLVYIVNHASDRMVFADAAFAPILARVLPQCPTVESVIYFSQPDEVPPLPVPQTTLAQFLEGYGPEAQWGGFDERSAAGLCYTSGTTGNPKGVLYSHRSNYLHAMTSLQSDVFGFSVQDTLLPVVPMFHANAWAMVFSAPAVGARLVLPGARLDGASLFELIEQEGVTVSAGVPTVWLGLLQYMSEKGLRPSKLRKVIIGGGACPERVIRDFHALGIEPLHAWGMTEMSPIGGVCTLTPEVAALPFEEQIPWRLRQGRSPCGVGLKLLSDDGQVVSHDGVTPGRLFVKGPAITSSYFKDERQLLDDEGYLETGDIATIDSQGFMRITDRAKDVIKSGGEWISSLDIENAALMHPQVALAAAIARLDERWGERPILIVTLRDGAETTPEAVSASLEGRIPRWWMPDEVVIAQTMPLGSTGKIDKKLLREQIARGVLP
ncbi:long-chain fatty acid--CoA ligase [Pseudomonas sp. H11T01]|uniref:long-chain fatty acid--CoA ligase n=1 Tax=Pseudomonas sp. H11T01 TaxID=3402749 RepID=UPI003AD35F20